MVEKKRSEFSTLDEYLHYIQWDQGDSWLIIEICFFCEESLWRMHFGLLVSRRTGILDVNDNFKNIGIRNGRVICKDEIEWGREGEKKGKT